MSSADVSILVAGEPKVGKTSTCNRLALVPKEEALRTTRTIMSDVIHIVYQYEDGRHMHLKLTDVAGDQTARTLVRVYYRNLHGVLLVCDVTRRATLDKLRDEWLPEIRKFTVGTVEPEYMLIVNKMDLPPETHEIRPEELRAFCETQRIHRYTLSSAETWSWATNPTPIDRFFLHLVKAARMKRPAIPEQSDLVLVGRPETVLEEVKSNCVCSE
jgi:small GTP-binding protein